MHFDALLLSRIQFAWVIALHILLPAFTVGLSCFIATLELIWWKTGKEVYGKLSAFWIKIFAVSFGMGVVSGIVMPFQFGTNWSRFTDAAGAIIGAPMAYEVLTAFFLESAFLGILLFGRAIVPRWAHALSAVLVAIGTLLSSFWILAVNSWMQTPSGYKVIDGRFFPTSMFDLIFTASFPYRLAHTVSAFVVTTAFVILAVGAFYLRQQRAQEESRVMIKMSLFFLLVMVPVQMMLGDMHGINSLKYQPAKVAAMEGLWDTGTRVPATLFALPDAKAEKNRYEISVPVLGSLYLTHSPNGKVQGLKDWAKEDRPPVTIVFFAFRIMVGVGILMLIVVIWGLVLWSKRKLYESRAWLKVCQWSAPLGFIAVLAGWTTTEVGRQPWTVYGLMRTANSVTPSLTTSDVAISLLLYILVYAIIFSTGFWLMLKMVKKGPIAAPILKSKNTPPLPQRPQSPISAVTGRPS